jgi:hypothetical protein
MIEAVSNGVDTVYLRAKTADAFGTGVVASGATVVTSNGTTTTFVAKYNPIAESMYIRKTQPTIATVAL